MTHHWIFFSIIATLSLGVSMALYKIPSIKSYSSILSTFWTNLFSAAIILVALWIVNPSSLSEIHTISWYGVCWGILFAMNMILTKKFLNNGDVGAIMPVTSSLGNVIVIIIGIIVLSEHVSLVQVMGIFLIISSVFFFSKKEASFPKMTSRLFLYVAGIIGTSTASKYIQKLGAVHDTASHFQMYQYLGAAITALIFLAFFERENFKSLRKDWKTYWKGALLIAIFSTIGGWAILKALSIGPLSGVYAIHPSYTFITALAGYFFFKEKLTSNKIALVIITILGVVLIKIG